MLFKNMEKKNCAHFFRTSWHWRNNCNTCHRATEAKEIMGLLAQYGAKWIPLHAG